jgi:hypothetical protein
MEMTSSEQEQEHEREDGETGVVEADPGTLADRKFAEFQIDPMAGLPGQSVPIPVSEQEVSQKAVERQQALQAEREQAHEEMMVLTGQVPVDEPEEQEDAEPAVVDSESAPS